LLGQGRGIIGVRKTCRRFNERLVPHGVQICSRAAGLSRRRR
jgi:hypothetical protein